MKNSLTAEGERNSAVKPGLLSRIEEEHKGPQGDNVKSPLHRYLTGIPWVKDRRRMRGGALRCKLKWEIQVYYFEKNSVEMPRWTFLSNYGLALSYIALHSNGTAREIADAVGITERATRKIIADLSAEGYIIKSKQGRCNSYGIDPDLVLQHPAHEETPVGELLKALGWRRKARRRRVDADSQRTVVS